MEEYVFLILTDIAWLFTKKKKYSQNSDNLHRLQSMGSHRVGHDWSDLVVVVSQSPYFGHILKKNSL